MAVEFGNGKICYIEMPAKDIASSAAFYREVFGWKVRTRDDGSVAFDDGVGQVSGTWTTEREPMAADPMKGGMMVHIMVDDAEATVAKVRAQGGAIVKEIGEYAPTEIVAIFRDPAGNVLGIYQERGRKQS
jgi:uncharacterized protein